MRQGDNPKESCGTQKIQLQLCPPAAKREMALAHMCGADKYGPWNWRDSSVNLMTYISAMQRHLDALQEGEDYDPESKAHHLGHVMACCGVVIDALSVGRLNDDRPK